MLFCCWNSYYLCSCIYAFTRHSRFNYPGTEFIIGHCKKNIENCKNLLYNSHLIRIKLFIIWKQKSQIYVGQQRLYYDMDLYAGSSMRDKWIPVNFISATSICSQWVFLSHFAFNPSLFMLVTRDTLLLFRNIAGLVDQCED